MMQEKMNIIRHARGQSMKKIFVIILIVIGLFGCKGKETAKETPPVQPSAEAPDSEMETKKDFSSSVGTAPNQPPRVEYVDVVPLYPKIGDTIKVIVKATDPDGDEVNLIYMWFKNGEPLFETSDTLVLSKDSFKRGDLITMNVIPDDGKAKGVQGMMKAIIGNASPQIVSTAREGRFEDRKFTYQIRATDPEGDPLKYSLKQAPEGMTINADTGLIQWDVPADFKDKAQVTVLVTDDKEGEAVESFIFETSTER